MKNDINDIKSMLEQEQEKARNKKELENDLFITLYNFVKTYKGYTNGALVYIEKTDNKEMICKAIAKNQEEYIYLIINYNKICNNIKKAFKEDARQELITKQKQQQEHEPLTIFGVHWALVVFLCPVALLMILFDDL